MASKSPPPKRLRLDPSASPSPPSDPKRAQIDQTNGGSNVSEKHEESLKIEGEAVEDEDHCVICLHHIRDRTVLPCAHDRLCFECIFVWCQQSRKCPLCNASIGPFLIHNLRSKYDYSKYFLPPLRTSSPPSNFTPELRSGTSRSRGRGRVNAAHSSFRRRNVSRSRERREREDDLELAIQRRRWIYRHGLYAKHVASNPYTRYRPAPTPAQITASPDLISRATIFIRRELRVWVNLDVEFLTTFILSLMKSLDLRSESAVKLLAEFLDMDTQYYIGDPGENSTGRFTNAEHFSHELYSYLRSPFRDLTTYDAAVQYDIPSDVPPAPISGPTEQGRWDRFSSGRSESASRRRRRPSSPPLSRSPRDAYSRSPSPIHSDSYFHEYRRRRSPRVRSAHGSQQSPRHSINNRRAPSANSRDVKGKRKASLRSGIDTWKPHGDGDRIEPNHTSSNSERRLDSPTRSDGRRGPSVPRELLRRSPLGAPTLPRRGRNERSDKRNFRSKSPSAPPDGNGREEIQGEVPTGEEPCLSGSVQYAKTVDQPEPLGPSWGISIKGQAKLLSENQPLKGEVSDIHPEDRTVKPTSSVPKKRSLNTSSLDVLHAHLGHGSKNNRSIVKASTSIQDIPTKEQPKATIVNDDSSGLCPTATVAPQDAPMTRVSAREIMARTRAKLAKLRTPSSQTPAVDIASDSLSIPTAGDITEAPPSVLDLRSRLMRRLEEEKRQAANSMKASTHREQLISDHPRVDETQASEAHGIEFLDIPNGRSPESHQAGIKHKSQVPLSDRLAAEKRKAGVPQDESALSREEALRSRLLLSKRT